ncbi:MAG: Gfo/Idh/MocA family oxidoreductase [Cyclobacteriaceae bacterium]|nr:Gfo/Idh/MocA family oxidoreductase [Cyclobacteriaceae bacterium HetDA_MAG_MS6]
MDATRRRFLAKSILTTSGLAILPQVNIAASKPKPLGIGIIGTGDRGTGLATLIQNIQGIKLKACCDIFPFRLDQAMKLGDRNTKRYTDYKALLDDKNVEAVIIATPFGMHADMAIDALEAGKHVYCEKTLSFGIDATRQLVRKAKASKQIFQTGHQYHSSRLYRHIVDLVKNDEIGQVSLIESQWNRNGDWRRPVPEPQLEKMINWRMYREFSGGLSAELCSHQIDFSNWIVGAPPVKVMGSGGIDFWKDGRETYDNVHIITEYSNGTRATYTSLTTNSKDNYQIKVLGKKGSILINQKNAWIYREPGFTEDYETGVVDGVSGATKTWHESRGKAIEISHQNPSIQALVDFRDNIVQYKEPLSNIDTGAQVAVIVQMALNAMDNDRVEHWKEEYNFV